MTECHLCSGSPESVPTGWDRECLALLQPPVETVLPPVETVLPPVAASRRMLLRSAAPLGLLWVGKVVPVVTAPEPSPGAVRMGWPHDLGRRAGMLTGSPSANSLLVR